jgi:hypothetical protein
VVRFPGLLTTYCSNSGGWVCCPLSQDGSRLVRTHFPLPSEMLANCPQSSVTATFPERATPSRALERSGRRQWTRPCVLSAGVVPTGGAQVFGEAREGRGIAERLAIPRPRLMLWLAYWPFQKVGSFLTQSL